MFNYELWNLVTVTTTVIWALFLLILFLIIFQEKWKKNRSISED